MARRIIAFIVTSAVLVTAGYQLAWHKKDLDKLGGLGGLIGAIALIVLGLFAAFWPDRWNRQHHRTYRRLVTIGALVSFFFGGDFIKNAFGEASGWALLWVVIGLVAYLILLVTTTLPTRDEAARATPRTGRVRDWAGSIRSRLLPARGSTATSTTGP